MQIAYFNKNLLRKAFRIEIKVLRYDIFILETFPKIEIRANYYQTIKQYSSWILSIIRERFCKDLKRDLRLT